MKAALLVLAAAAAAFAAAPAEEGRQMELQDDIDDEEMNMSLCLPEEQCYYVASNRYGALIEYQLYKLCDPTADTTFTDPNGNEYFMNICGTAHQECVPAGWRSFNRLGTVVQTFGDQPECNLAADDGVKCTDPRTGDERCCTKDCEVLGFGAPVIELIDNEDPTHTGLDLHFYGVPAAQDDPFQCPIDPESGDFYPRQATVRLHCNWALPDDQYIVTTVVENVTHPCHYMIVAESGAACGCEPDCQGKNCGGDGCGGVCSAVEMTGDCPEGSKCLTGTGVCCTPQCRDRECGDDLCNGICGTCPHGHKCHEETGRCHDISPTYKKERGRVAGALFGGLFLGAFVCLLALCIFTRQTGRGFNPFDYAPGEVANMVGGRAAATAGGAPVSSSGLATSSGSGYGAAASLGSGAASNGGGSSTSVGGSGYTGL